MARAFGGAVHVKTRDHRGPKENLPLNTGALNAKSMNDPGALAGVPGTDVKLIHGPRYEKTTGNTTFDITGDNKYTLTGSSTVLITGTLTETINGSHHYKVLTNLTLFVKGTTTEERIGAHLSTNSSSLTEVFIGPVTRNYEATTTEEHPETWIQKIQEACHFEPFKYETFGIVASAAVSKFDAMGASVCIRGVGLGVGAEEGQFKLQKLKVVNSEEELHATMIDTFALQMHLGAMDAGTPFKPNALPRPTPITPFD